MEKNQKDLKKRQKEIGEYTRIEDSFHSVGANPTAKIEYNRLYNRIAEITPLVLTELGNGKDYLRDKLRKSMESIQTSYKSIKDNDWSEASLYLPEGRLQNFCTTCGDYLNIILDNVKDLTTKTQGLIISARTGLSEFSQSYIKRTIGHMQKSFVKTLQLKRNQPKDQKRTLE